jgi:hypothetical protein
MTITQAQADKLRELITDNKDKMVKFMQAQDAVWSTEQALRVHIMEITEKK